MAAKQRQIFEKFGDLRVVSVLVLELQRETFRQVAREYARRVEALQHLQNLFDQPGRSPELFGKVAKIEPQITGLVDRVNQMGADQPFGRIRDDDVQLLGQIVGQRQACRNEILQVGVLAAEGIVRTRSQRRPPANIGTGALRLGAVGFSRGVGAAIERGAFAGDPIVVAFAARNLADRRSLPNGFGLRVVPLQQGIALNLGLDERAQLDVGQLQ